jgi:hypothetical protein
VAETKADLRNRTDCEGALGQVYDRAQIVFQQQPERGLVVGLVLGVGGLEVICIPRLAGRIRRTGLLAVDPLDPSSPGVLMLLRLFCSSPVHHFGFVNPVVPNSWVPPGLSRPLCDFVRLRAAKPGSPHGASVYSAALGDGEAAQDVVVKFSKDIELEVCAGTQGCHLRDHS